MIYEGKGTVLKWKHGRKSTIVLGKSLCSIGDYIRVGIRATEIQRGQVFCRPS